MTKFKKALATLMAVACTASALCVPMSVSASSTTAISESESNNTFDTADIINRDNVVINGKISSSSDVDYYRITPSTAGYCDITLSVPSGCNYNFYVYNVDRSSIMAYGNQNGSDLGEIARTFSSTNTPFYIKVVSASGYSTTKNYKLYVSNGKGINKTWYSQYNPSIDNGEFNTYNLDSDFLSNLSYDGCAITSIAMMLHNMNAKTAGDITDSRTGYKGKMYADPYTVYMASKKYTSKPTEYDIVNYTSTIEANIEEYFGVNLNSTGISSLDDVKPYLNTHPEGIVVKLTQTDNSQYPMHYVVLMKSNNSDGYVVYDPGTQQTTRGNGVTFSNSYSHFTMGFDKWEVDYMISVE